MKFDNAILRLWHHIPLDLRKRWWEETKFSSKPISEELEKAVTDAIAKRK
jgi:hypothetical protein